MKKHESNVKNDQIILEKRVSKIEHKTEELVFKLDSVVLDVNACKTGIENLRSTIKEDLNSNNAILMRQFAELLNTNRTTIRQPSNTPPLSPSAPNFNNNLNQQQNCEANI